MALIFLFSHEHLKLVRLGVVGFLLFGVSHNVWSQYPVNRLHGDVRERLIDMFRRFDSEENHKYARPRITNNSNGGFAWGISYLMESYLVMYEVTRDTSYLSKFFTYARLVLDNTDVKRGIKDYKGRIRCGWSASSYSADKTSPMIHFVHTGMILYPLLKFCLLAKQDFQLKKDGRYTDLCNEISELAESCVQQLEPQWRFSPASGQGYYTWEGDEPIKTDLSIQPPLNGQAAMGKSLAVLYRLTSRPEYLSKVRALANLFVNNSSVTKFQTLRWGYRADTSRVRRMEDISHGAIDVELAVEAWHLKLVDVSFLRKLANTLIFLKNRDGFAQYVDGSSRYKDDAEAFTHSVQSGRWLGLSEVDCRVYEVVLDYYLENLPGRTTLHPSGMLGIANLLKWYDPCYKAAK